MKQQYENVLIVGATSQISIAFARLIAPHTQQFVLCGRNESRLREVASDLKTRWSNSVEVVTSVDVAISHRSFDLVVFCTGFFLGNDEMADWDASLVRETLQVNFVDLVCDLVKVISKHDKAHDLKIVVLGSIAGDRGKARNRSYAAAKSGLATYIEGLRQTLIGERVKILLVKPGPTRSPMTTNSSFHLAEPEVVARDILLGLVKHKNVIYSPYYWKWIMFGIRLLPEPILRFVENRVTG